MSLLDAAAAAGLGLSLGVVTGMPIGVVNVAILDAATRGRTSFAIGIGIGGALADTVHAAVAFVGVGRLVTERPGWARALAIAAAIVIIAYALTTRSRRTDPGPRTRSRGVVTGLLITLPNPAALGAWVAIAAAVWPSISLGPALVLGAGVGAGSAAWFTSLARWIAKLPAEHRVTRALPTVALVALVAIALAGVVRTV